MTKEIRWLSRGFTVSVKNKKTPLTIRSPTLFSTVAWASPQRRSLSSPKSPPCKAVDSEMCHVIASTFDPDESVKNMEKYWYKDMVWDGPIGYGNCSSKREL